MMINWRSLFDEARIEWKDRGPNTSRNHINIRCPGCGNDDPSHHLSINENTGEYYCFRNPKRHSGRSISWLLYSLGLPRDQAIFLMQTYSDNKAYIPKEVTISPKDRFKWSRYESASKNSDALRYLFDRGFPSPYELINTYDLRYAPVGHYARRLLMPLTLNDEVVGFTGRAWDNLVTPKYLNSDPVPAGALYVPIKPNQRTQAIMLVEGPMDALAIADAVQQGFSDHSVVPVAMLGLAMPQPRLDHLLALIGQAQFGNARLLIGFDADQLAHEVYNLITACSGVVPVIRCALPSEVSEATNRPEVKDAAEMRPTEIRKWIRSNYDSARALTLSGRIAPLRSGLKTTSITIRGG